MKKLITGFVVGGLLGGAVGFAVAIFVYPFIFLADIVASETVADAEDKRVVATGEFVHADPGDSIHYGKGRMTLYEDTLFIGPDFEVGPGPKFHVYLVPLEAVTPDTDVAKTAFVDLGRLRAFKGSQVFPLPAGLQPAGYGNVVIWCEQFGVLISPARLVFQERSPG